jgi:hypothetical protein
MDRRASVCRAGSATAWASHLGCGHCDGCDLPSPVAVSAIGTLLMFRSGWTSSSCCVAAALFSRQFGRRSAESWSSALMGAGAFLGIFSFVLIALEPAVVTIYVMVEIFAASPYSSSRNLARVALVESACLGWMRAENDPITFML